jgi:hypothetical protein
MTTKKIQQAYKAGYQLGMKRMTTKNFYDEIDMKMIAKFISNSTIGESIGDYDDILEELEGGDTIEEFFGFIYGVRESGECNMLNLRCVLKNITGSYTKGNFILNYLKQAVGNKEASKVYGNIITSKGFSNYIKENESYY